MAFNVPQRGRPKATEGTKRILLRESTFRLWNERKELLNIKGLSNSQFAEILLHQNVEELRARSCSYQESAETSNDNEAVSSKISVLFIYFAPKASVVLFLFLFSLRNLTFSRLIRRMFSLGRRELFQSTPLSKRARIEIDVSPVVPDRNEEDTNTL